MPVVRIKNFPNEFRRAAAIAARKRRMRLTDYVLEATKIVLHYDAQHNEQVRIALERKNLNREGSF